MKVLKFFDKIEDKIRYALSKHPIVYSFIGGVAIVLFWRGVWMTADLFDFMTGPVSLLISVVVLLLIGLFVSFFIGDDILIHGMRKEKKIAEKTIEEIKVEDLEIHDLKRDIDEIKEKLKK